jgi:hypothetical protein
MKNYSELLKDYIGKKGELRQQDGGDWVFSCKKAASNVGKTELIDAGRDYAEFVFVNGFRRFVPLNLLIVDVE